MQQNLILSLVLILSYQYDFKIHIKCQNRKKVNRIFFLIKASKGTSDAILSSINTWILDWIVLLSQSVD